MAVIITVAQRKGGAGKTTLCCQLTAALAGAGVAVGLVDLDDQRSLADWAAARQRRLGALDVAFEACAGYGLSSALRRVGRRADVVFVDTPPTADLVVKRAVSAADLALAPMQLSPLDLGASLPTARLIGEARRNALFVINRAPPRARIAERIREKIVEFSLPVADVELGNRAAYAESLASGAGAVETDRNGAAAREITALAAEIAHVAGLALPAAA